MRKSYTGNEGYRDGNNEIWGLAVRNTILQQIVSVGNTATKLPTTPLTNRLNVTIQNQGNNPVFIGSSTVTTAGAAAGYKILPNAGFMFTIEDDVDIYGIVAAGTENVLVMEGA